MSITLSQSVSDLLACCTPGGPGYRAPDAKENIDEGPFDDSLARAANEKADAMLRRQYDAKNVTRRKNPGGGENVRFEVREAVFECIRENEPIDSREIRVRMGRHNMHPQQVCRALRMLVNEGRITCNPLSMKVGSPRNVFETRTH